MTTPCTIIPFPAARQVGKVRAVADGLAKRSGERKGGEGYWRQVIDSMARRMRKVGLADDVIDRELRAFHDAVATELTRLHAVEQRQTR